jgi:hypothetical protein
MRIDGEKYDLEDELIKWFYFMLSSIFQWKALQLKRKPTK